MLRYDTDIPSTSFRPARERSSPSIFTNKTDRRTVASYQSYPEAVRAVDYLADREFPVERLTVMAKDLRYVEHVTGRVDYWKAAGQGAASGAVIGAALGFFFGLFNWIEPLVSGVVLALYGLVIGALIGALTGVVGHALSGGRRDFSSVPRLDAGRFEVIADPEVADEASAMLAQLGEGDTRQAAG